jgi:alpha-glucosidase
MDAYKIFTWHPERFSRPKAMLDTLKRLGFHVVTIVDPGIKIDTGYFAHDEGVKRDYFVKYPDGRKYIGSVWPGRCYFPDFTNDSARKWWGASFARLIEPGVEGFWNDMNEPAVWGQNMPDLVEVNYDGVHQTMREAHNIYGMEMARSTYEGSKALLGGQRPFVLTRAGYSGVQRYSAIWTGDNVPTDEHMMLGVRLVNSMGLAGMPFAGPDVGGFSGDATPELFARWMSIGAYTPFFRNHKQNGMKRQEPWSLGEHVEEMARASIEERYRLLPYIYSTFYESTQNGMPVERSLAIDYSFDEHVYWQQFQQEYLLGQNILVAPVASKEEFCEVYLPEEGWYRSSDDQLYEGKRTVIVKAPLENLPVFVRAGAIIPKQSLVQYTASQPSDTLELHVYFGKGITSFVYYEDDGATFEYEQAKYYRRSMGYDGAGKEIVLAAAEGTYASRFNYMRLRLHGFPEIRRVTVNGASVQLSAPAAGGRTSDGVVKNTREKMVVKW